MSLPPHTGDKRIHSPSEDGNTELTHLAPPLRAPADPAVIALPSAVTVQATTAALLALFDANPWSARMTDVLSALTRTPHLINLNQASPVDGADLVMKVVEVCLANYRSFEALNEVEETHRQLTRLIQAGHYDVTRHNAAGEHLLHRMVLMMEPIQNSDSVYQMAEAVLHRMTPDAINAPDNVGLIPSFVSGLRLSMDTAVPLALLYRYGGVVNGVSVIANGDSVLHVLAKKKSERSKALRVVKDMFNHSPPLVPADWMHYRNRAGLTVLEDARQSASRTKRTDIEVVLEAHACAWRPYIRPLLLRILIEAPLNGNLNAVQLPNDVADMVLQFLDGSGLPFPAPVIMQDVDVDGDAAAAQPNPNDIMA